MLLVGCIAFARISEGRGGSILVHLLNVLLLILKLLYVHDLVAGHCFTWNVRLDLLLLLRFRIGWNLGSDAVLEVEGERAVFAVWMGFCYGVGWSLLELLSL